MNLSDSPRAAQDQDAVARFLAGDEGAFAELVERHKDAVRFFVRAFACGAEDVDDLSQEVFVEVYRSLGKFRGEARFGTWLYGLARNVCRSRLRARTAQRRRPPVMEAEEPLDVPDPSPGPAALLEGEESRRLVRGAMEALPDGHRAVLVLSHWEGLRYSEIARILDIPEGTVKSRAHNAVMMLAGRLGPLLGPEAAA